MFAYPLDRPTRYRLLICLLLLTALLAAGAGVFPVPAQNRTGEADDGPPRYIWINGGVGGGQNGMGTSVAAGVPVTSHHFLGLRHVYTEELRLFGDDPPNSTRDVGFLGGFVEQGRYGHISLGSGLSIVTGRRSAERSSAFPTLCVPIDLQAVFSPVRYLGIGVHGYATVTRQKNLIGAFLQLQVRIPQ